MGDPTIVPLNSRILIIRTPKEGTPNFRKLPFRLQCLSVEAAWKPKFSRRCGSMLMGRTPSTDCGFRGLGFRGKGLWFQVAWSAEMWNSD